MNIATVRTNFSQFSDGLVIHVSDGTARIELDVGASELEAVAMRLIDVADDCLAKLKREGARDILDSLLKEIQNPAEESK